MTKGVITIIIYCLVPMSIVNATLSAAIVDPLVSTSPAGIVSDILADIPSEFKPSTNCLAASEAVGLFIATTMPRTYIALERILDKATCHFAPTNTDAIWPDKSNVSAVPSGYTRILIAVPAKGVSLESKESCCSWLNVLGASFSSIFSPRQAFFFYH